METSAKVIEILILSDELVLVTFSDGTIATLEALQVYRLAVDLKVLKPATRELDDVPRRTCAEGSSRCRPVAPGVTSR
jgi:hypothetical protein